MGLSSRLLSFGGVSAKTYRYVIRSSSGCRYPFRLTSSRNLRFVSSGQNAHDRCISGGSSGGGVVRQHGALLHSAAAGEADDLPRGSRYSQAAACQAFAGGGGLGGGGGFTPLNPLLSLSQFTDGLGLMRQQQHQQRGMMFSSPSSSSSSSSSLFGDSPALGGRRMMSTTTAAWPNGVVTGDPLAEIGRKGQEGEGGAEEATANRVEDGGGGGNPRELVGDDNDAGRADQDHDVVAHSAPSDLEGDLSGALELPEKVPHQHQQLLQQQRSVDKDDEDTDDLVLDMEESSGTEIPAHPWPEWKQFLMRLRSGGYFDEESEFAPHTRDVTVAVYEDPHPLKKASLKFGRERDDLFEGMPVKLLKVIADAACPDLDRKVINSAKRLRAYVGVKESSVCDKCERVGDCERRYMEAQGEAGTPEVVRLLVVLARQMADFGSVPDNIASAARALLADIAERSATPRDPLLPRKIPMVPEPTLKGQARGYRDDDRRERRYERGDSPRRGRGEDRDFSPRRGRGEEGDFFARRGRRDDGDFRRREDRPTRSWDDAATKIEAKPGDWQCSSCHFVNFARNSECRNCNTDKKEASPVYVAGQRVEMKPGDWKCPSCNYINFARNDECRGCGVEKEDGGGSSRGSYGDDRRSSGRGGYSDGYGRERDDRYGGGNDRRGGRFSRGEGGERGGRGDRRGHDREFGGRGDRGGSYGEMSSRGRQQDSFSEGGRGERTGEPRAKKFEEWTPDFSSPDGSLESSNEGDDNVEQRMFDAQRGVNGSRSERGEEYAGRGRDIDDDGVAERTYRPPQGGRGGQSERGRDYGGRGGGGNGYERRSNGGRGGRSDSGSRWYGGDGNESGGRRGGGGRDRDDRSQFGRERGGGRGGESRARGGRGGGRGRR
ncbi:hypothetical protein CBR_g49234 [Chara braunii]|uniref:RanBP2-type domain-containing protein n=1 Tax=Chara braunii TaxID=69332 RepID=A0A388M4C9_CHABU|nr:hypothetical protein CBR_g49234 [Chara braunii]|eukprot:GBG89444.1 hypothetical protein CBR_g49234 [Chara braunii]